MEYNNWSGSNRTSNLKSSTCMWCSQGTAHKMHTCMCTWKRWKSLIISQLISCNNYLLNLQWSLFNADKSVKLIKCFFKCLYEAMCQLSSEREEWNWANLPHLAPPCTPPPPQLVLLTHLKSPNSFPFECLPHRLYKVNQPCKTRLACFTELLAHALFPYKIPTLF